MNLETASKYHRYIIVSILVAIISFYLLKEFPNIRGGIGISLWLFNVFCCYKLAESINKQAILWAFLGLLGFAIIWIPQLLLINAANKLFKAEGMKIGFLGGASKATQDTEA